MIIILWFICSALFVLTLTLTLEALFHIIKNKNVLHDLTINFPQKPRESKPSNPPINKLPVELYKWVIVDDERVCDDCLERASWAPMDIANWMKEGMPRTPEADTECGEECQCRLVPYKPTIPSEKQNNNRS